MNTIILTGAIFPTARVQRNDPQTRLIDYLCAIRRWLDIPTLKQVIYCDASTCVIPECIFGSEKFESLSFDASEHAQKYGAGRGEIESLAFVLNHSRFSFDSFFKCTGRIFVKNFQVIAAEIEGQPLDFFLRPWYVETWADTRLFRITIELFFKLFVPHIHEVRGYQNGGYVLESLFHKYRHYGKEFSEPCFVGHGGHCNNRYEEDFLEDEKEEARETIKKYGMDIFIPTSL